MMLAFATAKGQGTPLSVSYSRGSYSGGYQISCHGVSDGSINLTVSGGVTPYSFLWSNSATTQNVSGIAAGTYSVTVSDSGGVNVDTLTGISITQPATLTATTGHSNVNCHGASTGSAWAIPSGGTSTYSYLWSNGGQTTDTASGLPKLVTGYYVVTVTDANSCTATSSADISEPSALTASIFSHTDVSCNGGNNGSAIVVASGGTPVATVEFSDPHYMYSWNTSPTKTTDTVTNLSYGTYTVIVTDGHSCTVTTSVTVTQPSALSVSTGVRNVLCYGGNTGYAYAIVSGGTLGYSYLWSNSQTVDTAINLSVSGAAYSVTVTDGHGCTKTASATISQPAVLVAFFSVGNVTDVSCFGGNNGRATVTVVGGTASYSYIWSNSATGLTDSLLTKDTYYVTVTDSNSCTATASININEPPEIVLSLSNDKYNGYDISCSGGSTTINTDVNGGTPSYSYLWSDASTGTKLSGTAETYSITITDAHGCIATSTTTLTEPTIITDSISSPVNGYGYNVSCMVNDGEIELTASGGVTPYSYAWSNSTTTQNNYSVSSGLSSVTITDANGCTKTDTITLTAPTKLTAVTDSIHVYANGANVSEDTAHDGSITALVTGGTTPYTYQWSTPNVFALPTPNTNQTLTNCYPYQIYYVLATDANACTMQSPPILLNSFVGRDFWSIHGNVIDTTRFIGTLDSSDLVFKTDTIERMRIKANGEIQMHGISKFDTIRVGRIMAIDSIITFGDSSIQMMPSYGKIMNDEYGLVKGIAIGKGNLPASTLAFGRNSTAIGWNVRTQSPLDIGADGTNSVIIGSGDPTTPTGHFFYNNKPNTLMVGFNSDIPTLFVGASNGNGTTGYVGIGNSNPLSDLQIGYGLGKVNIGANTFLNSPSWVANYIGFNAARDNNSSSSTYQQWITNTDGGSNGGSVIMGDIAGGLRFVNIKGTSSHTEQQITDSDIITTSYTNMIINGYGMVGIGTTSPYFKLDINTGTEHNGLRVKVPSDNDPAMQIDNSSNSTTNFLVQGNGEVYARAVHVIAPSNTIPPDYVFDQDYKLKSLIDLGKYIEGNHHLPEIPSASEITSNGIDLGEMNLKLLKKIEEQTLYIMNLQKQLDEQNKRIGGLEKKN